MMMSDVRSSNCRRVCVQVRYPVPTPTHNHYGMAQHFHGQGGNHYTGSHAHHGHISYGSHYNNNFHVPGRMSVPATMAPAPFEYYEHQHQPGFSSDSEVEEVDDQFLIDDYLLIDDDLTCLSFELLCTGPGECREICVEFAPGASEHNHRSQYQPGQFYHPHSFSMTSESSPSRGMMMMAMSNRGMGMGMRNSSVKGKGVQ